MANHVLLLVLSKFQMQLYLTALTSVRVSRRITSMFFSWNHQRTPFGCLFFYLISIITICIVQEPELGRHCVWVQQDYSCIRTIQYEMFPAHLCLRERSQMFKRKVTLQIVLHWMQEQDMQRFFYGSKLSTFENFSNTNIFKTLCLAPWVFSSIFPYWVTAAQWLTSASGYCTEVHLRALWWIKTFFRFTGIPILL